MRVYVLLLTCLFFSLLGKPQQPRMMYEDTSRRGVPFSKDPHVVNFQGRYLMYYTLPPRLDVSGSGANIGIASSKDLVNWSKVGDDAICHAVSTDGIHFDRDPSNPVFHPTGDWNCGRAIDAEVCEFNGKYFLYFATRDKDFKIQMQGVATASLNTDFNREDWTQACDKSILYPECDWEGECIEGASIVKKDNKLYMFYAGAYNNAPQQIGVAVSEDGLNWKRLSEEPFLRNGKPGEWNSSESGHPHLFTDLDGRTYLFYQGNNDHGKTWYITQQEVLWKDGKPYLK